MDFALIERPEELEEPVSYLRLAMEHKSVLTAHRNASNRQDDVYRNMRAIFAHNMKCISIATVLIGTVDRYLNVADYIRSPMEKKGRKRAFDEDVLPRFGTGDPSLWEEFIDAVSKNRQGDAQRTKSTFMQTSVRQVSDTHEAGLDYLLLIPVEIDNVNPPRIADRQALSIDAYAEYDAMIDVICRAYTMRWHAGSIKV